MQTAVFVVLLGAFLCGLHGAEDVENSQDQQQRVNVDTTYTVRIFTGDTVTNGTETRLSVTLVGKDGKSNATEFEVVAAHKTGSEYNVTCSKSLGKLGLIELRRVTSFLERNILGFFARKEWSVDKIEVTSPSPEELYTFPIFHYIEDEHVYQFREGKAVIEDCYYEGSREEELKLRSDTYKWEIYADGVPHCIQANTSDELPHEVRFSFTKRQDFFQTAIKAFGTLNVASLTKLNLFHPTDWDLSNPLAFFNLFSSNRSWHSFDDIEKTSYNHCRTNMSDYVKDHWREDAFFGYQFLNGINPIMIRRISSLPSNFSVTDHMVTLEGGASMTDEMQKGNIFLIDYKILDGVETNNISGEEQYLAAPLVLLHRTPGDELKPIAIQLKQIPAEDNPVFLPTDSEYDWLLAKTFVRNADAIEHELNTHLLRTHLLSEVFTVSLLRNMASVHPLFKLLKPHTRDTLEINLLARQRLISEDGILTLNAGNSRDGMFTILQRALSSVTYSSLCLPDDIKDRGVESVPNYYYRDDGLRLWDIIHRFVKGLLSHYYKSDEKVQEDAELQKYIKDIFENGFYSNNESGIPQNFSSVDELVKFATMVIFLSSAQHAAVNGPQLDIGAWMPNFPLALQRPPPATKGEATEETLLNTLPDVHSSVNILATLWLLSHDPKDKIPLGEFPYERFTEEVPNNLIEDFQKELEDLDRNVIDPRNEKLEFPYIYLKPENIENSITI